MLKRSLRFFLSLLALSTLLMAFGNCGRLENGGSGEPYEGVSIDPADELHGNNPDQVAAEYVCSTSIPNYSYLTVRVYNVTGAQTHVAVEQTSSSQIDLLYQGTPSGGLNIPLLEDDKRISEVRVANSPVRVTLRIEQGRSGFSEDVIFNCSR